MNYFKAAVAVLGIVALLVAVLFLVQNSATTVQLTFDLGRPGFAWRVGQPMPFLWLVAGGFGLGLIVSIVPLRWYSAASRKVRQLEQQIALGDAGGGEYR